MFNKNSINGIAEMIKIELEKSFDIEFRTLESYEKKIYFMYITSVCEVSSIQQNIIIPFYNMKNIEEYRNYVLSFPKSIQSNDKQLVINQLLHGFVAIFFDKHIILFDANRFSESNLSESQIEKVVQGPKDSIGEKLDTSLNIIRSRYHRKTLKVEQTEWGLDKMPMVIIYDHLLVDYKVLAQLKARLEKLQGKSEQSSQLLHKFLMKETSPIIPTILLTDRPDRIVLNLNEGKIIVIIEGSPFALILPAVFFDFMSSMEDIYQLPLISKFIVFLRYIGLLITVSLPGFYVGMASYTPELFRFQLALSIAGSRIRVPYPPFVEVLAMLLMMELLSEASSRLPNMVGQTATTVGGLIIGQAASEAGLVSNIMIIIVSSVAISNFIIPINSFNFAVRIIKYLILLLSIFFGLIGVIVGVIGILFYIANIRSFGTPYLQLFSKHP